MPEANLLDVAHEASPYEDVVCVGLFQPAERAGTGAKHLPQWSLVAVTESKVHIFAVRSIVPYATVSHPRRPTPMSARCASGTAPRGCG